MYGEDSLFLPGGEEDDREEVVMTPLSSFGLTCPDLDRLSLLTHPNTRLGDDINVIVARYGALGKGARSAAILFGLLLLPSPSNSEN